MAEGSHPKQTRYEVAIVGGGPAGLLTAIAAARNGVRSILLVEKRRAWGTPVQCAEAVPKLISLVTRIPHNAVANRVRRLAVYLEGKPMGSLRMPGFILRREVFERDLARQAEALGVECLQPARVAHVGEDELTILVGDIPTRVAADIIVGADGPLSIVRDSMNVARPRMMRAIQYALPLSQPSEIAETYFLPKYGAGYAWCFPKGDLANVGLALDHGKHPRKLRSLFHEFMETLHREGKISDTQPQRRTGGLIPASGPVATTLKENKLLVGDAAGQTDPLTGAGIHAAVACGRFAGEAIARAVQKHDLSLLRTYEEEWRGLFEGFLTDDLLARTQLAECRDDEYADILGAAWRIRKSRTGLPSVSWFLRRVRRRL